MNAGRICRGIVLLSLLAGLGCSTSGKPIKVEGVVMLDGKPLPNAAITLLPDDAQGRPASGVSGTDGSFRLTTLSSGDGAMAGTYKVTVNLTDTPNEKPIDIKDAKGMMDAMKEAQEKAQKAGPKKANLPVTYTDPSRTTLKQVIPPPEGKMTLDLRNTGS